MNNRAFYDRFLDEFLDGQIHGRGPTDVVPAGPIPGPGNKADSSEHILRWEDDGGPVLDAPDLFPQLGEAKTRLSRDVAGAHPPYDES